MAWLRLDDQITHHVKFLRAGPSASWLWVCCLAHCQRQLTDGFVAFEAMPLLGAPAWKADIKRLVAVGLMQEVEGGYTVHDYLDHNASRADVLAKRSQDAARKGRGIHSESTRNPYGNSAEAARIPEPRARVLSDPIRTTPIQAEPERERAPFAPLVRSHAKCASHCAGMCVPSGLHEQFIGMCRGMPEREADAKVSAFYASVDADPRWQGTIPEADVFKFLKARWTEHHGGAAAVQKTPRELRAEAVRRELLGESA